MQHHTLVHALGIGLALLSGCSATMVSPPGGAMPSAYAPVNEAERGGVIKYDTDGEAWAVAARREDAYKQMHRACGGTYRIDAEGPQLGGGGTARVAGPSVVVKGAEAWYIHFSCVPEGSAPVAARR